MSRVIKSDGVGEFRPAFPVLQTAPPEAFLPVDAPAEVPEAPGPAAAPPAKPQRPPQSPAQAVEVDERARALERRAMAVMEEARETAAHRLAEAEAEAAALVAGAREAAEQIRTEAREAGAREGYEQGYQEGRTAAGAEAGQMLTVAAREAETMLAEVRSMAESIRQGAQEQRARMLDTARMELLDLAFAMARQVLKAEIALRPEAMLPMLEAALTKLKGEEEPQVRVSPTVHALLEEHRGRLLAAIPGARRVVTEADPGLADGDFVVQGTQGYVDGRLERQVQVLEADLRSEER